MCIARNKSAPAQKQQKQKTVPKNAAINFALQFTPTPSIISYTKPLAIRGLESPQHKT